MSTRDGIVKRDYGVVHHGNIRVMCLSKDGQFLFTGCDYGGLRQWSIRRMCLVKDYKKTNFGGLLWMEVADGRKFHGNLLPKPKNHLL